VTPGIRPYAQCQWVKSAGYSSHQTMALAPAMAMVAMAGGLQWWTVRLRCHQQHRKLHEVQK
jgi:hypothetical protein